MKISLRMKMATVVLLGVLGGIGCSTKGPVKESSTPTVMEPYDRMTRITYEKYLQCGKSSWGEGSKTIVFTKEARFLGEGKQSEDLRAQIQRDSGLWEVSVDTLEQKHVLRNTGPLGNPHAMPDRRCMYQWGSGHVAVIELDSLKSSDVLKTAAIQFGSASLSEDGKKIAFIAKGVRSVQGSTASQMYRVETAGTDGGARKTLCEPVGSGEALFSAAGTCFSADGQEIFFASGGARTPLNIFSVRLDDRSVRQVTEFEQVEGPGILSLTASPDGQWIAFTMVSPQASSRSSLSTSIWLVRTDGTGNRQLVERGAFPAWASDSRTLAFTSGGDLWICRLSDQALQERAAANPMVVSTPKERLRMALRLASDGLYDEAIVECDKILADPSSSDLGQKALYLKGQWQVAKGDTESGLQTLETVVSQFPISEEAILALKRLDTVRSDQQQPFPFEERLNALLSEYDAARANQISQDQAALLSYLTGLCWDAEIRGDIQKALGFYEATVKEFPNTWAGHKAQLRVARCLVTMGRMEEAKDRLQWVMRNAGGTEEEVEAKARLIGIDVDARDLDGGLEVWKDLLAHNRPLEDGWAYGTIHQGMIGLATLALDEGRPEDAMPLLDYAARTLPQEMGEASSEEVRARIDRLSFKAREALKGPKRDEQVKAKEKDSNAKKKESKPEKRKIKSSKKDQPEKEGS